MSVTSSRPLSPLREKTHSFTRDTLLCSDTYSRVTHDFPSHRAIGRGLSWKNTSPEAFSRPQDQKYVSSSPAVSARELTSNHGWRADPVRADPSTVTRTRTASTRHTVSAPLSLPLAPSLPSPPPQPPELAWIRAQHQSSEWLLKIDVLVQ